MPGHITAENAARSAPIVKAGVADMKHYWSMNDYRMFPVGTTIDDISSIRSQSQNYLACTTSSTDSTPLADFIGINNYAWCGDSSSTRAGFPEFIEDADGHGLPVFLAEVCILADSDQAGAMVPTSSCLTLS